MRSLYPFIMAALWFLATLSSQAATRGGQGTGVQIEGVALTTAVVDANRNNPNVRDDVPVLLRQVRNGSPMSIRAPMGVGSYEILDVPGQGAKALGSTGIEITIAFIGQLDAILSSHPQQLLLDSLFFKN